MKLHYCILCLSCLIGSTSLSFAQTNSKTTNPWSFSKTQSEQEFDTKKVALKNYQAIQLNIPKFEKILKKVPLRFSKAVNEQQVILAIPYPDGTSRNFTIAEAPVLHPDLGKQFPNIRSYEGIGMDDPIARLRFDWSPYGFHAMILSSGQEAIFIENYSKADRENYFVYYKNKGSQNAINNFTCGFKAEENVVTNLSSPNKKEENCVLRTYRIAIACTGQYGQYHGGTIESVLAAMNTTLTRVNGIYENDLAVSFQIIPNNTDLIFLDSINDPYYTMDIDSMIEQNQIVIDRFIGGENYDLGHLFNMGTTTPLGRAYRNGLCQSTIKAKAVTGPTPPEGHIFDVDYVSHEIGHQLGALHTFNGTKEKCAGRSFFGGVEIGSGSTIMGYAGICGEDNVQLFSDPYFHGISIAEMNSHLNKVTAKSCAKITDLGRAIPIADAGKEYTIPISTPFILEAKTETSENDNITYCWEQIDTPNLLGYSGPLFRSFPPKPSNKRFFPALEDLVNKETPWELLPTVDRKMKFRLTVRENTFGGGCTASDDVEITVVGNTDPFVITYPNDTIQWSVGTTEIVTWEVANTNVTPINSKEVNIFLSTDGGLTFSTLLVENVPNIGQATISVPSMLTKEARLMVIAADNIFFDISDYNFEILEDAIFTSTTEKLETAFNWTITPNPFHNHFIVDLTDFSFNHQIDFQVTDILGRLIFKKNITSPETFEVATQQWKNGIYFAGLIDVTNGQPLLKFKRILHH